MSSNIDNTKKTCTAELLLVQCTLGGGGLLPKSQSARIFRTFRAVLRKVNLLQRS